MRVFVGVRVCKFSVVSELQGHAGANQGIDQCPIQSAKSKGLAYVGNTIRDQSACPLLLRVCVDASGRSNKKRAASPM